MTYPPLWDFKKHGPVLQGTYEGFFPNIGRYRNTLYVIRDKSGKKWTIWGTREIKLALQMRPPGKKVRIQFLAILKDKKHTSGIRHFKINIGRGNENATTAHDRGPMKKKRAAAAGRTRRRQLSAPPLTTEGRRVADGPAAKNRLRKKKIKEAIVAPVEVPAIAPPPVPPPGYNAESRETFLEGWKRRLKKI